jgi:hypothetical protein
MVVAMTEEIAYEFAVWAISFSDCSAEVSQNG